MMELKTVFRIDMLLPKITVLILLIATTALFSLAATSVRSDGKTLVLFVETTEENTPALVNLAINFITVSTYINPNWFNQFVIVTFGSFPSAPAEFATIQEAAEYLKSEAYNPFDPSDRDQSLLKIMIHGLSSFTFNPKSVVYLITTAGSSVSDQVNGPTLFKALLGWQVQLQYVLINTVIHNNTLDSQSVRFLANLAITTGGNFFELSHSNQTTEFISAHLPTLYDSAFIADATQGSFSCVQTTYYAAVEADVGTVYLYVYSNSSIPLVQSNHNTVPLSALFDDGHARIFSFSPADKPGIYTVSMNDEGPCNLQIRSQKKFALMSTTVIPSTLPTTPSPDVDFDIGIIFDLSLDTSPTHKSHIIQFFINTLSFFNYNRFHLATDCVCGDFAGTSNLETMQSENEVAYLLGYFAGTSCTASDQDALTSAVAALDNLAYGIGGTGYRPNINNHLIVYATSNGSGSNTAIPFANEVIKNGTYGIVAVAYESDGNNIPFLTALVGNKTECVITADDYDDLTITAAEKLIELIWHASNNNGQYC